MRINKKLVSLLAGLALASPVFADTTITNVPSWDGGNAIVGWSTRSLTTFGQTFTTGASDTVLNSFTFYLTGYYHAGSSDDISYKAYVAEWDGSKMSNVVWSSGISSTGVGNSWDFQKIDTNTGKLELKTNTQYVAFFSTSGLYSPSDREIVNTFGLTEDTISGGSAVMSNNHGYFSQLSLNSWTVLRGDDLAFSATLTAAVPEPETYVMLLAGLGLIGVAARRRRA
ncbi:MULTISPECIES: PEP-CTERM sorting domain-containing protein [unclassified Duganella]|uniref:PEP-CTERM sorting domain-containing protein n=1 Tax=unclassified Duganella TaxID=2636909 RepID=UPI0008813687|nr:MULTISPECIES: PEP-CTERM sorting domain-containing protein [unclassified Duganella]SDF72887.1 PEP-CTERM protein-sorting domain-containing protein [Duganella sp. OV458]SDI56537.1 PEP-CTERM protein-sorting domain-containing protein [Duganella sp. OV510]